MILGIDWGERKIGLATADERGIVIRPKKVLLRSFSPQKKSSQNQRNSPELSKKIWTLEESDRIALEKFFEEEGGIDEFSTFVLGNPYTFDRIQDISPPQKKFNLPFYEEKLFHWRKNLAPQLAEQLYSQYRIPVFLVDESLTSWQAIQNTSPKKNQKSKPSFCEDAESAELILKDYFSQLERNEKMISVPDLEQKEPEKS